MPNNQKQTLSSAETYYDSTDADRFYETVWGGEDIHIGLYDNTDLIREASRKTVKAMVAQLLNLGTSSRVIDLGAGYGGSARFMAKNIGCKVTCINISEVQNARNREFNKTDGLEKLITVKHGSFENIPEKDKSFDVVWSQDSFLHSNQRDTVLAEIVRVTAPSGELIFTDPMQADVCPEGVLQPVYDRLDLETMGSFAYYRHGLSKLGFEEVCSTELTDQLRTHYANVRKELLNRYDELVSSISPEYMDKMIEGLDNWVRAADQGYLSWGILHFRKTL
jgi:ubiquinone/menaquinone biosynthesis C-methylase UbiE